MLEGIDVASYQGAKPDMSHCDIVAIKVTEGLTYVNPEFQSQLDDARTNGCGVIFYHYPHIAESISSQLQHFLTSIGKNLRPQDVFALDWEWYGQNVTDDAARTFKDQWIKDIRAAKKNRNIVYADLNNWKNVDKDSNCGDGLWIADYNHPAGKPDVQHPWIGHQYTSRPEDMDAWNFKDRTDFVTWATANFTVPPTPTKNGGTEMPIFEISGTGGGITFPKGTGKQVSFFLDNTLLLGEANQGVDLRVVIWADNVGPEIHTVRVHNTGSKQITLTFTHASETHSVTVSRADKNTVPVHGCVS